VAVFAIELSGVDLAPFVLVPARLTAHPSAAWPSLLTHMFLHAGVVHIAGNMLFLWIFGDNVEDVLGHVRYVLFYLVCGVAAGLVQVAAMPSNDVPMLGASGAIAGVLAAYFILYPTSPISVINPIPILWLFWGLLIVLPAWLVIAEFFVINLLSAWSTTQNTGVAFAAHIGGFLTGLVLLPILRVRRKVDYDPVSAGRARPRRRAGAAGSPRARATARPGGGCRSVRPPSRCPRRAGRTAEPA
jgi:membrane associated rhomboid family serine protease